jgi:hypothetical protein
MGNIAAPFATTLDPDIELAIGVAALLAVLIGIQYGFKGLGWLLRLWQAARETVLTGAELDEATRARLIAQFDLLPEEEILAFRYRRFFTTSNQSVIVTQKRISQVGAGGPVTVRVPEIRDRSFPGVSSGRFVVGPFEIKLQGGPALMFINVMGGGDASKLRRIIEGVIARHGNDDADERVPQQSIPLKTREGRGIFWVVAGVPMVVGICLLALGWRALSPALDGLGSGEIVAGKVVGYERRYDTNSQDHAFYPTVQFTGRDGISRTFTSPVGGMKIYDVGQDVEVLQDRDEPTKASINSFWDLYLVPAIFAAMAAIFFALGIALVKLVRAGV